MRFDNASSIAEKRQLIEPVHGEIISIRHDGTAM